MSFRIIEDPKNNQVIIKLFNTPGSTARAIRSSMFQLGTINRTQGRKNITVRGKTGRLYRIKDKSRRHRASAPGEEPSNLTGKLRKSVNFTVRGADQMEFGYDQSVKYGKFLELGTRGKRGSFESVISRRKKKTLKGGGMEPRPNLLPIVLNSHRDATAIFNKEFAKELAKGSSSQEGVTIVRGGKTATFR